MSNKIHISLLTISCGLLIAGNVHAAGVRPIFQMPFSCGQTWEASTYNTHWPDQNSIDLAQRSGQGDNISEGEPVLASASGTILDVKTGGGGDHRVYLDHGNGWKTYYLHLEQLPPLEIGQKIAEGEVIGRTSNSGAVAMHLHYTQVRDNEAVRIKFNGKAIDTHAGNPDSYGTWGGPDAEKLTSSNCPENSFMGFNQNGEQYKLIYKPGSGLVKIVKVNSDGQGVTTTWQGNWTQGWTHLTPFFNGNQWHSFVYKASTGKVSFLRLGLNGDSVTNLTTEYWGKGWTHFIPLTIAGNPYFIAYNSLTGYAKINRISVTGGSSTTVYENNWVDGRTSLVPYAVGSHQYILLYKGGTGEIEINEISGSGYNINIAEVWSAQWSKGWTSLVSIEHESTRYLLGYKAPTGLAKIIKLNSNGQGAQTVNTMNWTSNWTSLSPLSFNGKGHLFIYKAHTGNAKIIKLNSGGIGVSTVWQDGWTKGWN